MATETAPGIATPAGHARSLTEETDMAVADLSKAEIIKSNARGAADTGSPKCKWRF